VAEEILNRVVHSSFQMCLESGDGRGIS